ncbi:MAG: TRAP transporter fused permease subunit [Alphaproteobacteria bacterium]|nr:TRAP transporter fused permease subunit [Alphaproteobacteria bacterium]
MQDSQTNPAAAPKVLRVLFPALGQLCCVALAFFIAATTIFGKLPAEAQYAIALTLSLLAVFLLKPGVFHDNAVLTTRAALINTLLILVALGTGGYYLMNYYDIAAFREGIPNTADLICYAIGTAVVVEAARRVEGWVLVIIVVAAFFYLAYGHWMPGVLNHRAMPFSNALEVAYSYKGIYGIALGAVVDVVMVFVILGAAIRISGAGDFFNFIAMRATSGMRSGPAQAAIIASTLFGSVNGSAPANVASTGVLTIPMMKRAGYSAGFAGGVESTASCVGQIMPPIMGVGAFIMSEITGIPYATIMLVAVVPAFLFIFSLSIAAILEAQRLGIKAQGEATTDMWSALRASQAVVLVLGFGTLLAMLFSGFSPTLSGLSAAGVTLAAGFALPQTRFGWKATWEFLVESGKDGLSVMIACAAIGIVIGAVSSTGLGVKLNQLIVSMGSGDLLPALILAAICSIVLGMGLPTAASYLMVVFVAGPSLMELGVSQLQTHFFVFYYAVLSAITPPVALAVFAAAAIAREKPLIIAANSLRLCAVAFVLPIVWIYHPEIFLDSISMETIGPALVVFAALTCAIVGFNAAHIGCFFSPLRLWQRLVLAVGAAGAVYTDPWIQAAACGMILLLLIERYITQRRVEIA